MVARDAQGRYSRVGSRGHWLRMIRLYKKAKEAGLHDGSLASWLKHVKMWNESKTEKIEKILAKIRKIKNSSLPDKVKEHMIQHLLEIAKTGLYKAEGDHWITIPTLEQNPEEGANRRHILLDEEGRIKAGDVPKAMQGQKINDIEAWRKLRSKKEENEWEGTPFYEDIKALGLKITPHKIPEKTIKELEEKGREIYGSDKKKVSEYVEQRIPQSLRRYEIGHGMEWTKDKFGRDTPARGHIAMIESDGEEVIVDINYNDKDRLKEYGAKWVDKAWRIPISKVVDVLKEFPNGEVRFRVIRDYNSAKEHQKKIKETVAKDNKVYDMIQEAGFKPTFKDEGGKITLVVGGGKVTITAAGDQDALKITGNTYNLRKELEPYTTLKKERGEWVRYAKPENFVEIIKILKDFELSPDAQKLLEETWTKKKTAGDKKIEDKKVEKEDKTVDPYHMEDTNFELPKSAKKEAMKINDLYDYQKKGVNYLLHHKKAILGYSVGLGKTLISTMAALKLIEDGKVQRAAVIVPASRKYGWKDEIEKFAKAKAVVLDPDSFKQTEKAKKKLEEAKDAQFIITNYEVLRDPDKAKIIHDLAPDLVIADEGHKLKNYKAKQTKGFEETYKDAKYKWLLTATPMPNAQPLETYTMLKHVAPELAGSWSDFSKKYVVFQEVNTPYGIVRKPVALKNMDELREKIKEAIYIKGHNSPDVNLQLPSKRDIMPEIDMTPSQAKLYNAMEKEIIDDLNDMTDEDWGQKANNILAKIKRLEEIAIDPALVTGKDEGLSPKEEWAVDYAIQHLDDPTNRGLVIFCDYKLPLEKIKQGLIDEGVPETQIEMITGAEKAEKRQETERNFNNGSVKIILATSAAEEGFNLQHGGHTLIHLDQPWVPKSIVQREGRIARQGQPNPFTIMYSPVMRNTIEAEKVATLQNKAEKIKKLLGDESDSGKRSLQAVNKFDLKDIKKLFNKVGDKE